METKVTLTEQAKAYLAPFMSGASLTALIASCEALAKDVGFFKASSVSLNIGQDFTNGVARSSHFASFNTDTSTILLDDQNLDLFLADNTSKADHLKFLIAHEMFHAMGMANEVLTDALAYVVTNYADCMEHTTAAGYLWQNAREFSDVFHSKTTLNDYAKTKVAALKASFQAA